jgi:hypothetical protein
MSSGDTTATSSEDTTANKDGTCSGSIASSGAISLFIKSCCWVFLLSSKMTCEVLWKAHKFCLLLSRTRWFLQYFFLGGINVRFQFSCKVTMSRFTIKIWIYSVKRVKRIQRSSDIFTRWFFSSQRGPHAEIWIAYTHTYTDCTI